MEVMAATPPGGGVPPFHDHDVREWSRLDSLTGVLERARLETDNWSANTNNARHKYNKVVDSRARTDADGALEQSARRQLEVYQSQIPGGHLQVIKTHTVSSSRWTHRADNFENLQLTLNPLDLSPEKSKANLGRGAGRRPPTRQRSREDTAASNLRRVSRLCHQIHDEAVRRTFGSFVNTPPDDDTSGDGVEIQEIRSTSGSSLTDRHESLQRTKSSSSEDLPASCDSDHSPRSAADLEDLEELQNWRRTSKIRRSLQHPKTDLPENVGNVRRIREELEKGRRLNAALRGNNVDLEALDQILQGISNDERKPKRNSFVTVESLQEVKGRLRRTSTPTSDIYKNGDDDDDGVVTEESTENSRVRSYVYGMEMLNKNTGSLGSRTSNRNDDWYNRRKSYGFERVHQSDPIVRKDKEVIESSTDSGICRSTEIVIVPTPTKTTPEFQNGYPENNVKKMTSIFDRDSTWKTKSDDKSTTITIPIISNDYAEDKEIKRHSIAVDESKYVTNGGINHDRFRRTSLAMNGQYTDDDFGQNRRSKKVEFCKTEVHFAADSGKVNIVETDEKPPPTNNFRRRRRNSGLNIDFSEEPNGLPVLHFGDSSYEKSLLGLAVDGTKDEENIYETNLPVTFGNVTVNTNPSDIQEDEHKENYENENIRGILKNKTKPIPYHLGDELSHSDEDKKWGVKLKPVQTTNNDQTPIWKSTVTVHNTVYENGDQPEFQRLLKNLRPTKRPDLLNIDGIENKTKENTRGYSTKVNFGDGEAIVVSDDKEKLNGLSNGENSYKDPKTTLNKGLVVRIGHEEYVSKQSLCSKTSSSNQESNNTTTTKITIDLNPSPLIVPSTKYQRSRMQHSFKSTSLILDTIRMGRAKDQDTNPIPQQLEALRKLYEDVQSDSDADKEVQRLMEERDDFRRNQDDNSSVVSGSWSKMRACRLINEHTKSVRAQSNKTNAHSEKGHFDEPLTKARENTQLSSPSLVGRNTKEYRIQQKYTSNDIVLRQPKRSEMTYFGVKVSPEPAKKTVMKPLDDKPDLLQHTKKQEDPSPIYENVRKEFDATILDELTKAADQILQAVHDFEEAETVEISEPLATISETKSLGDEKQRKKTTTRSEVRRAKRTPSTSSVESVSKPIRKPKVTPERMKKNVPEVQCSRAAAKARRLQRASSREALLQSHGSSSEDLQKEVPTRKPRQIKKTKSVQLTMTNGLEMKKPMPMAPQRKREMPKKRPEESRPVEAIPEIVHKTAVSTIKSTREKARERSKTRHEEIKSKTPLKRECSKGSSSRSDLKKTIPTKETINHRISTAYVPVPKRRSRSIASAEPDECLCLCS